eukprot:TRINITY_DN10676_c0_g1_i1.p1 TRINITY_DN10676_c0_g1~~TRINITY_DN10676_c0_g1_i1.p1  ORF type:complete len:152 (-),score=36.28 TRINITY_DN10676_c0_g1_i1:150-605(-)
MTSRRNEEELREVFSLFDKDGNGSICPGELEGALKALGMEHHEAHVKVLLAKADLDGDGMIEFEEFKNLMWGNDCAAVDVLKQASESELRALFKEYDVNGDGYITTQELRVVMEGFGEPLTDEEAADMMKSADSDDDGRVNYFEFAKLMRS